MRLLLSTLVFVFLYSCTNKPTAPTTDFDRNDTYVEYYSDRFKVYMGHPSDIKRHEYAIRIKIDVIPTDSLAASIYLSTKSSLTSDPNSFYKQPDAIDRYHKSSFIMAFDRKEMLYQTLFTFDYDKSGNIIEKRKSDYDTSNFIPISEGSWEHRIWTMLHTKIEMDLGGKRTSMYEDEFLMLHDSLLVVGCDPIGSTVVSY